MTIFITGASGFIGSHFLKRLLETADSSAKIYVFGRAAGSSMSDRVQFLKGDLAEIHKYSHELLASDYVYHIAANATFGSDQDYAAVNTAPTAAMIQILKGSQKLKNLIYISTIGAVDRHPSDFCAKPLDEKSEPAPRSEYGRSKLEAEILIKKSGLPFTIVRPTWVYGEGMRGNSHIQQFVSMAAQNKKLVFLLRFMGRVSLIHVTDLVNFLVSCINNSQVIGQTLFALTENLAFHEILSEVWLQARGERVRPIWLPGFLSWVRFFHRFLPLTVTNLFADYLLADPEGFRRWSKSVRPILFKDGLSDVIQDNPRLHGQVIITGANSGIGFELARRMARQQNRLILIDRDTSNLNEFRNHQIIQADLSDPVAIESISSQVVGRIKALVNNAGVGYKGSISELDENQIVRTLQVNCLAPILLTKKLLGRLKKDQAVVVNVASSVAYNPLPGMSIYAASKSLVLSWYESLSVELKATNRVLTVSPSGTATNFQKQGGVSTEAGGLMSPHYVAEVIEDHLAAGAPHVIIGGKSKILLAASRFLSQRNKAKLWGLLFAKLR